MDSSLIDDLPLTPTAEMVLQYAAREAGRLRAAAVEPVHLFLGAIRHGDCFAARGLRAWGASPPEVGRELEPVSTPRGDGPPRLVIPCSSELEQFLRGADTLRRNLSHRWLGTEHLLLTQVMAEGSAEARVLARHGLVVETVRRLLAMQERGEPPDGRPLPEAALAQALVRRGETDLLRLLGARRAREGVRVALVDSGQLSETDFLRLLREEAGYADYDGEALPAPTMLDTFPPELARDYELLPFEKRAGRVRVLCLDPFLPTQRKLVEEFGSAIEWVPVAREELHRAIERCFGPA